MQSNLVSHYEAIFDFNRKVADKKCLKIRQFDNYWQILANKTVKENIKTKVYLTWALYKKLAPKQRL